MTSQFHSEFILDVRVDYVGGSDINNFIGQSIEAKKKVTIGNVNIHAMNLSVEDDSFKRFTNNADMVFCDGKGVQLAFFLQRKLVPPHVTYEVWMWQLLPFCAEKKYRLFFLGSKPGVAAKAKEKINLIYPGLGIEHHHGYFDKNGQESNEVIDIINSFKPHILIVGFGMPVQEKWIEDNIERIDTNVVLNGGAYLDWISGERVNCPNWMRKIGMEWVYRLMLEPRRLFKRYIFGNPKFIFRILKESYYA
jgi:N-acetylglucosaminyldiphosphoundecaprenol N-acetyl-beta-D-mannosaminyltransferase